MKTGSTRKALLLAHVFNLLVAVYFIIIAIISLVQLRWYHQLTITIKVRHIVTSATSYFAFLILIFAGLILIIIFLLNAINFNKKRYVNPVNQDAVNLTTITSEQPVSSVLTHDVVSNPTRGAESGQDSSRLSPMSNRINNNNSSRLVFQDSTATTDVSTNSKVCFSILLHLFSSISLIIILVIWLLNTGELVRDSLATQLESAFAKYQFANRSNHYSIAIDGMQDINNCCGALDYTDFPHQRISGLSSGHYPGSCCGKNIFGANARVVCTPEEIYRAKQTVSILDLSTQKCFSLVPILNFIYIIKHHTSRPAALLL